MPMLGTSICDKVDIWELVTESVAGAKTVANGKTLAVNQI